MPTKLTPTARKSASAEAAKEAQREDLRRLTAKQRIALALEIGKRDSALKKQFAGANKPK